MVASRRLTSSRKQYDASKHFTFLLQTLLLRAWFNRVLHKVNPRKVALFTFPLQTLFLRTWFDRVLRKVDLRKVVQLGR